MNKSDVSSTGTIMPVLNPFMPTSRVPEPRVKPKESGTLNKSMESLTNSTYNSSMKLPQQEITRLPTDSRDVVLKGLLQ